MKLDKRMVVIGGMILVTALVSRGVFFDYRSGDYDYFLGPWSRSLKENGGLNGLNEYQGDYPAAYVFILAILTYLPLNPLFTIKAVSVLFDFLLAFGGGMLVARIIKNWRLSKLEKEGYFLKTILFLLMLPAVILNSSLWGQCDSIYSAFLVWAVYFFIDEKYRWAMTFLGFGLAFKLQAIFLLPVFGILFLREKKFSFCDFFYILVGYFGMSLPAVLAGWPIEKLLGSYLFQVTEYTWALTLNFPNIYMVFPGLDIDLFYKIGVIFTFGVLFWLMAVILKKKMEFTEKKVLELIILVLTVVTYFLPGMHERYMFFGEIMVVIYFILYKENWLLFGTVVALPAILYALFSRFGWMTAVTWDHILVAVIYTVILGISWKKLVENIFEVRRERSGQLEVEGTEAE